MRTRLLPLVALPLALSLSSIALAQPDPTPAPPPIPALPDATTEAPPPAPTDADPRAPIALPAEETPPPPATAPEAPPEPAWASQYTQQPPSYGYGHQQPPAPPAEPPPPPAAPSRQYHLGVSAGGRGIVVPSAGYDPYSDNDFLPMFALGASYSPIQLGPIALGLELEYDIGGSAARARGASTSLTAQRVMLGLRADWAAARSFGLYAKVAPGVAIADAEIEDDSDNQPLTASAAAFALDAALGAALRVGYSGDPTAPKAGFWLVAELGYAFTTPMEMQFTPEEDPDLPRNLGETRLPDLQLSGFTPKLAFAVTF